MSVNTPLPSLNPRFPRWMERARSGCLYPDLYTWFVFFAAMDVMLTWTILALGGREINGFADRVGVVSRRQAGSLPIRFRECHS